jgi:hypothetical protein
MDPELLSPVKHRSAKAQADLSVIRARAGLVRARTALVNTARGLAKSAVAILRQQPRLMEPASKVATRTAEHLLFPQVTGNCDSCCECPASEDCFPMTDLDAYTYEELEQELARVLVHARGEILNDAEVHRFWQINEEILRRCAASVNAA